MQQLLICEHHCVSTISSCYKWGAQLGVWGRKDLGSGLPRMEGVGFNLSMGLVCSTEVPVLVRRTLCRLSPRRRVYLAIVVVFFFLTQPWGVGGNAADFPFFCVNQEPSRKETLY